MRIITLNWGGRGTGSIDNIRYDIEDGLRSKNIEFIHIYESGKKSEGNYFRLSGWFATRVYFVWAQLTGRRYETGYLPYLKFKKIVKKYQPDIVHIHCPNGYAINIYKVLQFLSNSKIATIITNHAEFFYTGGCAHAKECNEYETGCVNCHEYNVQCNSWFINRTRKNWRKMNEALHSIDKLMMVAVSPWVLSRMVRSKIAADLNKCTICNGVDTSLFYYKNISDRKRVICDIVGDGVYTKKLKANTYDYICVHVTSSFSMDERDLKGGRYVVELAKKETLKKVLFIIAGNINVEQEMLKHIPSNIIMAGLIENKKQLSDLYNIADISLMTSKRETYGMTCVESLCCGTPVIAFKNGGTESAVLEKEVYFVDYGEIQELERFLQEFSPFNDAEKNELSKIAQSKYGNRHMVEMYYKLYRSMVEK